jgi:hypothetical protein
MQATGEFVMTVTGVANGIFSGASAGAIEITPAVTMKILGEEWSDVADTAATWTDATDAPAVWTIPTTTTATWASQ